MANKEVEKVETLPNLDELLQCPVCYEIPSGQIYQCSEGHHICVRCKTRLDMCPVCRSLFFGTRNYAMEELIANIKKLQSFKLGGKITTSSSSETNSKAEDTTIEGENDEDNNDTLDNSGNHRPPQPCKGLFRCLCCIEKEAVRLPAARILNHLRYFHSTDLIEGHSENREYVQLWQFPTTPGRTVTALRIADMGIFFLTVEIMYDLYAWLQMASTSRVSDEFIYTVTISGNDREAIFSDRVNTVRECEGRLKKIRHCLIITDQDAEALTMSEVINVKLLVRHSPSDHMTSMNNIAPRTVLRVATRGIMPQTDQQVAATTTNGLITIHSNATVSAHSPVLPVGTNVGNRHLLISTHSDPRISNLLNTVNPFMSRNARKRMNKRIRALNAALDSAVQSSSSSTPPSLHQSTSNISGQVASGNSTVSNNFGLASAPGQSTSGLPNSQPTSNTTRNRRNKRQNRRHL